MSIRSHRDLIVWQHGVELAVEAYRLTRSYPDFERFGIAGQTQRAATSVPANIAEGRGRGSSKSFRNFLWIANGSLSELDTHLEVALRLGYVGAAEAEGMNGRMAAIGRMLTKLRHSLGQ